MQTAVASKVAVARGPAMRPVAVAMPKSGSAVKAPRTSVVPKAALEEVKSLSSNGTTSQNGAGLDFDELTDLIKMVHDTDIVELTLNSKRFKLSVKKKEALEVMEPQIVHVQAPPAGYAPSPVAAAAPAPVAAAPAAAPAPAPAPAAPAAANGIEIASPMAGTYYSSPAPGEPSFCKEGDRVTKGQTICIIEAMKLMNEIEAEASGTVVKILAENGKPVTPGQPLLIIKP